MVLSIPCGKGDIHVYEQFRGRGCKRVVVYRAAWWAPKQSGNRVWGIPAKTIPGALEGLFQKMKVKTADREAVWKEARKCADPDEPASSQAKPAISHKKRPSKRHSAIVFFKKHPFQGTLRHMVRKTDGKVRLALSRKGQKRVLSNWHATRTEALESIRKKSVIMNMDAPAISHTHTVAEGLKPFIKSMGFIETGRKCPSSSNSRPRPGRPTPSGSSASTHCGGE